MDYEKVWDNLNRETRKELLTYVYPRPSNFAAELRSETLREFEADLEWEELLPSTQAALAEENWSEILDREV